jgi:uncharacterized BrkB/YihY/UPF0761 family membrane protein
VVRRDFAVWLYLNADYNIIYGSLGVGVGIAFLIWMYLSFVVLVGAAFNAMLFPRTIARSPARSGMHPSVASA